MIEGYIIQIAIKKGLPYIRMRPFTNNNWNTLSHITVTSPKEWNPTALDSMVPEEWYCKQNEDLELPHQRIVTELGDLKPDLEDSKDKNQSNRDHHPVDQEGIKVFLS